MPWTKDSPPSVAKNWTDSEKEKCVAAANAVLRDGGEDQDAIFACIHAAGKSKGNKAMEYEPNYIEATVKAETYGGVKRADLKDSDFVFSDERVFPVMTAQDVHDAVSSWGRYGGSKNFEEFKRRLTALAKRKGLASALPKEWTQAKAMVKAVADDDEGEWVLDILAAPFGDENNRDGQGEWFDAETQFHEDKYPLPPLVYHHGVQDGFKAFEETPEYLGKTIKRWVDSAGIWLRGVLDKSSARARQVWEAAKEGMAKASSGSAIHLARTEPNGHIREWPMVEVSVFDEGTTRRAVNRYAVAIPSVKAMYEKAGIALPEGLSAEPMPESGGVGEVADSDAAYNQGDNEMAEGLTKQEVADIVAKALDDRAEEEKKAREAEEALEAKIKAAVDEAVEVNDKKWAEKFRLPTGEMKPPSVQQYADTAPYDNLDVGAHALLVGVLKAGQFARPDNKPPSDACVKALALKIESEFGKHDDDIMLREAASALKALPIKSNEVSYTTLSGYGDQWVGVAYSRDLWEKIRLGTPILERLMARGYVREVGQGFESMTIPLESTDPSWYKVAQSTAVDSTMGTPVASITSSRVATTNQSITLAKMGCRTLFTGEMREDSLIPWLENARRQMTLSGADMMEHAIINGDTTTTTLLNINDVAGTPGGTEIFQLVDGFRKLALVTNTANSRSAGTLTDEDYLDTIKLLGAAGKNARDHGAVSFIPCANTYWKSLALAAVKTPDVFPNATIVDGELTRIWGYEVVPSWLMHYDESASYTGLLVNTSGKLDIDTTTNNTVGAILAVRWDQWAFGRKRDMTLEVSRFPESDTNQVVALARWGLQYRDTDASAISYNVTV